MSIDRTAEFQRIIATRRAQQQQQQQLPHHRVPTKRSEFAAAASQIGADTALIADKLSKLTQLAQSQSLFQDPTVEINELTHIIKQDIQTINSKLASLQGAMAAAKAGSAKQHASHSTSVVDSLKFKLLDATKAFQEVLHTRSHNMQLLQDRRSQFSFQPTTPTAGGSSSTAAYGGNAFGNGGGSSSAGRAAPPAPIFELGVATAPPSIGHFGESGSSGAAGGPAEEVFEGAVWASPAAKPLGLAANNGEVAIDMSALQQQEQQMIPANSTYYDSRAQAVESVQSTIVELGGIFQQLTTMVASQGEMLQRVDEDVESSLMDVQAGREQLQLYWNNMSTNRNLMMKIFGVLFFFIVMWGTLFA